MKDQAIKFLKAAGVRALRTGIQTTLSFLTLGMSAFDVNWTDALGVTVLSMVMSLGTSILSGLPEVEDTAGKLTLGEDKVTIDCKLNQDELKEKGVTP